MKIGFIIYGLDRPLTGIGRYTFEVAKAFEALGADVTLLVAGQLGILAETTLSSHRFRLARLAPSLLTIGSFQIPLLVKKYKLDVVHDPTGITPYFFGLGSAKSIVSIHDVIPWSLPEYSSRFDTLIYRYWLPYVLPKVDKIITASQHSKSEIIKYMKVGADKIEVVQYGVNDKFHPLPTEEVKNYLRAHFQIDYPYLLYVGNLTQRKNLATYLRAFALIADEFPEYQLVIVGPSTFRASNLEPLIHELSLEKRIILTGHVAEEALPYLYNGADVFGFPSLYEGFGLPPLEAMACGTPVVVSNVSSLPEVVGEAALAIAPTDAEGFAEALQRLLKDEHLRQTLIEKGLAHAKQFTWKIATEKILAIYQKVL